MADHAPEERLAAHLQEGLACLRRGDPSRAQLHLKAVVHDEDLAASPDLADVRARACALLAQALVETRPSRDSDGLDDLDEADRLLELARSLDPHAESQLAPLQDALLDARTDRLEAAARGARSKRLAETDIEPLLARIGDPGRRLDLLLSKAQAEVDAGRSAEGSRHAHRVLEADSSDVRHPVMALLTLAAAEPEEASRYVREAYGRAEVASEFNLVAIVARTAEHLQVSLPVQTGPSLSSPTSPGDS